MMGTVLGMMVMMPVVFGVGGYALVSRRPEVDAKTMTGAPSARLAGVSRGDVRSPRVATQIVCSRRCCESRESVRRWEQGRNTVSGHSVSAAHDETIGPSAGRGSARLKRAPPGRVCGNPAEWVRCS